MKKLSYFFTISGFLIGSSGCVAVFNNPGTDSSDSAASSSGSSGSDSTSSLSIDSFAVNNQVGWLKKVTGTCGTESVLVSVTTGTSSGSTTCSSGVWSIYLDVSAESTGTLTLTASHNGLTASTTLDKTSTACDAEGDRDNTYAGGMAGGAGTSASPYVICTADQLAEIANGLADTYALYNDIYFEQGDTNGDGSVDGSDTDYVTGSGWTPVGTFTGNFDGNYFTISNLTIDRGATNSVGLFTRFNNATGYLKRINLVEADVTGAVGTGILVGLLTGNISRVFTSGSVNGTARVGGIVGKSDTNGVMSIGESGSTATVISSGDDAGGIVGYIWSRSFIYMSYHNGTVRGVNDVGGIVGYSYSAYNHYLISSYSSGTVTGTGDNVGGLSGTAPEVTYKSYSSATVEGQDFVGGLSGSSRWTIGSFATGSVSGASASDQTGPLHGNDNSAYIYDSYFYSGATCQNSGAGSCNTHGTAVATLSDFYSNSNAPLSYFDFADGLDTRQGDIWIQNSDSTPSLWFERSWDFTPTLAGAGTAASPYLITSLADLQAVASNPNYMDKHLELTASLDLSGVTEFDTIAGDGVFMGQFDGGGFTISNLTTNHTNAGDGMVGFLGFAYQATISDLTLSNVDVDSNSLFTAGGFTIVDTTDLTNLTISGSVDSTGGSCGGLFYSVYYGDGTNLHSSTTVNCTSGAGGLGVGMSAANLTNASATGNVTGGSNKVGGLLGNGSGSGVGGTFSKIFATGNVTHGGSGAGGGHLGGLFGTFTGVLQDCYAQGTVTSTSNTAHAGGLAGWFKNATVSNCYASGDVNAPSSGEVGGFYGGYDDSLNFSYNFATGNVTGSSASNEVGLFLGEESGTWTHTDNYVWSGATCTNGAGACNTVYDNTNANLSDFYDPSNQPMSGNWDFGSVWQDNSGSSALPTLQ